MHYPYFLESLITTSHLKIALFFTTSLQYVKALWQRSIVKRNPLEFKKFCTRLPAVSQNWKRRFLPFFKIITKLKASCHLLKLGTKIYFFKRSVSMIATPHCPTMSLDTYNQIHRKKYFKQYLQIKLRDITGCFPEHISDISFFFTK